MDRENVGTFFSRKNRGMLLVRVLPGSWELSGLHGMKLNDSGLWTWVDLSFLFSWTPKSLRILIADLKLKDACSLKEKL